jgi:hypothetical protein
MSVASYFSQDYRQAREKFIAAAERAGASLESFDNPVGRGPYGESLTTDVAHFGDAAARRLLVLISGTHGVEGFCGSGCQIGMIEAGVFARLAPDTQVLIVHAMNPYGFAWLRRVNEDNVDLNRNSIDHAAPPATNPDYLQLLPALLPKQWDGPLRDAAEAQIGAFVASRGMKAFQAVVSGGQYSERDGIFYGGHAPVWSTRTMHEIMRRHAGAKTHVALIDFHTGLGPSGHGEAIYTGNDDAELARSRRWYGSDVTSIYAGDSASAIVQGPLINGLRDLAAGAEFTPLALEYGTLEIASVLNAMRAEHWLTLYGDANSDQGRALKKQMRDAFYVDTDQWKSEVYARAHDLTGRALAALAA